MIIQPQPKLLRHAIFYCYVQTQKVFFVKWKKWERGDMEGRIQKLCLANTRTETRTASRTHFYSFRIWINVPKERLFPRTVQSSILILSQGT